MNEEKKPVVIGRMKSGKFRYHIEDDVFDAGGGGYADRSQQRTTSTQCAY